MHIGGMINEQMRTKKITMGDGQIQRGAEQNAHSKGERFPCVCESFSTEKNSQRLAALRVCTFWMNYFDPFFLCFCSNVFETPWLFKT